MHELDLLLRGGTVATATELRSVDIGVADGRVVVVEPDVTASSREVIDAAYSPELRVQFRDNFLRVPMRPAAGLYGSQLLNASRHGDLRAISRLPLLPPLAVSALLAYRLTGSDKGVW